MMRITVLRSVLGDSDFSETPIYKSGFRALGFRVQGVSVFQSSRSQLV